MLIDEILKNWEIDCNIDEDNVGGSAMKTPNLHAKYLRLLIDYKLKKIQYKSKYDEKRLLKIKLIKGHLTTEELKELGWEPFQFRILKGDQEEHLAGDKDLQSLDNKIEYCSSAIYVLESILQEIKSRSFHTRVAMDWIRFRAGG